jgi:hypothetical protein
MGRAARHRSIQAGGARATTSNRPGGVIRSLVLTLRGRSCRAARSRSTCSPVPNAAGGCACSRPSSSRRWCGRFSLAWASRRNAPSLYLPDLRPVSRICSIRGSIIVKRPGARPTCCIAVGGARLALAAATPRYADPALRRGDLADSGSATALCAPSNRAEEREVPVSEIQLRALVPPIPLKD